MFRTIDRSASLALVGGVGAALALGALRVRLGLGHGLGRERHQGAPRRADPRERVAERRRARRHAHGPQPPDFERLDPGQAYSSVDYEAIYATQRPLYSYKPNTFAAPTPDMASGPPEISSDRKTVTVHIRSGVHFSPPVNREVTSADVAYAIERGANENVANPYFSTYFGALEGASKANGGPIPGIATPNSHTIVFHLTEPKAQILASALVLPLSAPVPEEYARKYDAHKPTEYGNYLVATGPYMFKSNSEGKVLGIGYEPGKSATLVRNPNWRAATDFRPAYLNQIDIQIGGDPNVIGRQVLEGSHMVQNDTPAQSIVQLAYEQHPLPAGDLSGRRHELHRRQQPPGPVREREHAQGLLGGARPRRDEQGARRRTGHERDDALHLSRNPRLRTGRWPEGPAGRLQRVPRQGTRRWPPSTCVSRAIPAASTPAARPCRSSARPAAPKRRTPKSSTRRSRTSASKRKFSLVDQSVMYSKFCGTPAEEIDVCPNVGWAADFGDPQGVLDVTFNGKHIESSGNNNWGQVNDPTINRKMEEAEPIVGTQARAAAWARDRPRTGRPGRRDPVRVRQGAEHRGEQRRRRRRRVEHRGVGLHASPR